MKIDRNYHQALIQVADKLREGVDALSAANARMIAGRPDEALDYLADAKAAVEGAMVTAKWATTLPDPEDKG
jgi:hypothetical protein